jgi:hypothetical protein
MIQMYAECWIMLHTVHDTSMHPLRKQCSRYASLEEAVLQVCIPWRSSAPGMHLLRKQCSRYASLEEAVLQVPSFSTWCVIG